MIERDFSVPFVARLALREKQIQQNYRPVIAVHKWFARRPGALYRALLLSEFATGPLEETYYRSNHLAGLRIADPFMGGGTPLLEANRVGCDVLGIDINPMSYWIVRQEIETLDLDAYSRAAHVLRSALAEHLGSLYRTRCALCGADDADVKYFLWVKVQTCKLCGRQIDLFPGYLVAANRRHPKYVLVCSKCGELVEVDDRRYPGRCPHCDAVLTTKGPASRGRCACAGCGAANPYPDAAAGPPKHRLFAIEYYCAHCKGSHTGRFFKSPDPDDLCRVAEAERRLCEGPPSFVPGDEIPSGDETDRLHRWGYARYRDMFNSRQLLGLEASARAIAWVRDERVRNALATNLSDLLRYQNMLCRYDTGALKSLDVFSVHGFPVGLVQCESNLLGILDPRTGSCVGSGGWANIVEKYRKAKEYCEAPFEVGVGRNDRRTVPIRGERIGDRASGPGSPKAPRVELHCADASKVDVAPESLDAVLTDPPYYANVQYAELMDFCYVWLRRLLGEHIPVLSVASTRHDGDLTGNVNTGKGLDHFAEGLSSVFQRMAKALKRGAPFAFTYHHNSLDAYLPVAVAILDSGLVCSASLPCPAEMSASIHIHGTGSSTVDTVFVCRSTGSVPRRWLPTTPDGIMALVHEDVQQLAAGGVAIREGDIRCIAYGQITRLAVWALRATWDSDGSIGGRMSRVSRQIEELGVSDEMIGRAQSAFAVEVPAESAAVAEPAASYGEASDAIPF